MNMGNSYLYTILFVDKKIIPQMANDVKLISAGKILESTRTISQCKPTFGELPGGIITMHVVVQPSSVKSKIGEVNRIDILFFVYLIWS